MSIQHLPVLLEQALRFLAAGGGGCFVDCTLGLGGHAEAFLERSTAATLVGIDRDPQALELAAARLARFGERCRLVRGRFSELERLLTALGIGQVKGVLADLGVSALQLETAERGFSFMHDGPLDMRMGSAERQEITAGEIVNRFPEETLRKILKEYGEERQAKRIVRAIVERRREKPLETTGELRRLIEEVKPAPPRQRIHSATQTFQALRIAVNHELDELRALLEQAVRMLESKGRLVVISYHSLEDRIAKHTLRELAVGKIEPITGRPLAETQVLEVLTRKPVRPSAEEIAANPRSRSARLRAARRL